MEETKKTTNRHILILFSVGAIAYILFNYMPVRKWMNGNELAFLLTKLGLLLVFDAFILIFKKKWEIEIERPFVELNYLYLTFLLIPCFMNILASFVSGHPADKPFEWMILLDAVTDFFTSVLEDVVFVDLLISFLLNVLPKKKCINFRACLISSLVFSLVHCFIFMSEGWEMAIINTVICFFVTMACGYLAIFFDSFLIPVGFHFVYNALNYVFHQNFFSDTFYNASGAVRPTYIVYVIAMIVLTSGYFIALWHLSELQKKRVMKAENK